MLVRQPYRVGDVIRTWPEAKEALAMVKLEAGLAAWKPMMSVHECCPVEFLVYASFAVKQRVAQGPREPRVQVGDELRVQTSTSVPYPCPWDMFLSKIRTMIREFMLHELDESIVVNGQLPFDPHRPAAIPFAFLNLTGRIE